MLRKWQSYKLFLAGLILIFAVAYLLPGYLLPTDVLHNLPGFSQKSWEKPQNSLLADPVFQFEPWRHFAKEQFLRGQFPLINNQNGNGVPFFANPQTAVLYPLNFFYYLLPDKLAINVIPLLKLYLFGVFSFLYLRAIKCSRTISLIGSLLTGFSGFFVVWLLWPHTNVFLFFPLLLFATEKLRTSALKYRWYGVISLSYFFAILGGHPETLIHVTTIHLFYTLVRLWNDKRDIPAVILSIIIGYLFGAVQILPFLDYLHQSSVIQARNNVQTNFFLPIKSIILYIFPFLFGAPHLSFYKSIDATTNFQETIGGYTGFGAVLTAAVGAVYFWRDKLIKVWVCTIIACALVVYKIPPFWLIAQLPLIHNLANQRLVAFIGFGIAILTALTLEKLLYTQKPKSKYLEKVCKITVLVMSASIVLTLIVFQLNLQSFFGNNREFLIFLKQHVRYVLTTTLIYFALISLLLQKPIQKRRKILLLLVVPLLLQTVFLFYSYIPFTKTIDYYPKTDLVKKLQSLPKGKYLEVGNPSIPADVNLIYELSNIQSNDALGIASEQKKFNVTFGQDNQWGNPESVSLEKAQKLGIMYIISDYDINLYKQELQVSHINYFAFDKEISIPFKPKYSSLSQIRILPATYNRNNICSIHVAIFDEGNELAEQNIPCRDIRNNMYYTSAMPLNLETDKSYTLKLSTNATQNNIGLYGSEKDRPFVQLLFQEGAKTYPLVYQDKYYFLWKVPGLKQIQDNKYNPIWFLIGLSTTLVTAFFYFTYLAKKEFNFGFFKRLDKKRKFMARNAADISLCYHALVFLVGLTISAAIFVVLTQLFPIHFIMPDTTAINWYTVHHYPRQQDYFYFFGGFVIVVIGSFSMWVIWIWKKRK